MAGLLDLLYNFHWVRPDVARSAQPYLGFYPTYLRAHGIRSLINLRGANPDHRWWGRELRMAQRMGIAHYDIRLSSRLLPARESLVALAAALEAAPRPVLLKCSGGQDRASLAAALSLLLAGGAGARVEAQAQYAVWPYLHRPKRGQRWLRQFPAFAVEAAAGRPTGTWLRQDYTPEAFAAWLAAQGLADSYRGLQTPWLSDREKRRRPVRD